MIKIINLLVIIILIIAGLVWWEESRLVNTGFIPTYDLQDEIESLVSKGENKGLTKEESARLDWLLNDKKAKTTEQLEEWKKRNR